MPSEHDGGDPIEDDADPIDATDMEAGAALGDFVPDELQSEMTEEILAALRNGIASGRKQ